MLQEVIDIQNDAVSKIILKFEEKDNIIFKSPTGSGKTYMMASIMDKILLNKKDVVFLVSSLSKSGLAEQNYENFLEYSEKKIFKNINPFLISSDSEEGSIYIPTDYNVYVIPRDLYRKKSKLKDGGYLIKFLEEMIKGQGKKIYFIKDECHIATNNLDELQNYYSKVLNCSATPKLLKGEKIDILINEIDAVNAKLIKKVKYNEEEINLENIFDKFKEVKKNYEKAIQDKGFGKAIKPCLIIQISNKEKANEEIEEIKNVLKKTKFQDLQWMLIVDKDKDCDSNNVIKKMPVARWKKEAKKDESTIDVIIFKMVITEGWDIPRACMLYQTRNSRSQQLDEQVIGRVRRNPKLLTFEKLSQENQDLVTTAYVYGIKNKNEKNVIEVELVGNKEINEIQEEFKLKVTRLKKLEETKEKNMIPFLEKLENKVNYKSIFELYREYSNSPREVKSFCDDYIKDFSTWFNISNNIEKIIKHSKEINYNYEENMEIVKDENDKILEFSLPLYSSYNDNENYKVIKNWIWKQKNGKENFSFDSESEKEWCELLLELIVEDSPKGNGRIIKDISVNRNLFEKGEKKYLLGKNYILNSNIKFEYYLYGIHSSYPDFIMKDYENRIHLFESKSLNKSSKINLDDKEYMEKLEELKKCYKQSSKLTGYYFYIPIKNEDSWKIYQYFDGEEKVLDKNEFINFFKK